MRYFLLLLTIMITVSTFWMQVGVKNLKVVGNEGWALIHEGEAEKQVCVYIILFYINNTNSLFTIFSYLHVYLHDVLKYIYKIRPGFLFLLCHLSCAEAICCTSVDITPTRGWRLGVYILTQGLSELFAIFISL